MSVKLNDTYFVDCDAENFILKKKTLRTKKTDNTVYESADTMGYYQSMQNCITACVKRSLMDGIQDGSIATLKDYVYQMNVLQNKLNSIVND